MVVTGARGHYDGAFPLTDFLVSQLRDRLAPVGKNLAYASILQSHLANPIQCNLVHLGNKILSKRTDLNLIDGRFH